MAEEFFLLSERLMISEGHQRVNQVVNDALDGGINFLRLVCVSRLFFPRVLSCSFMLSASDGDKKHAFSVEYLPPI